AGGRTRGLGDHRSGVQPGRHPAVLLVPARHRRRRDRSRHDVRGDRPLPGLTYSGGVAIASITPSISSARLTSEAVTPPAEWVVQRNVSVRQRMSMSGWWLSFSAISATRFT